jgi:hypothetical protein
MIILWIRKSKKDKQDKTTQEVEDSFRAHNEAMKKFRQEHQNIELITDKDILTGDGNLLAPVQKVKLHNHVQN